MDKKRSAGASGTSAGNRPAFGGTQMMLGNAAVARGAYEAGVRVVSSYPGTPSTEITESAADYDEMAVEWAPNEKVSLEVALGASFAGARSLCAMKHVGLNVAADPLFTASYTGVSGGCVICVADDQGMHSSQNEQDSRHYAMAAKVPMLEPSDSGECKRFMLEAYDLSEKFDTPVLMRLSTRVSHSQSLVELNERAERPLVPYEKNPGKYVMMPAMARARHIVVEKRMAELAAFAETSPLNRVEKGSGKIGVITAGIAYQYAKEALGGAVSYLKLGVVYPLPDKLLKTFVESVDVCYVLEELDPFIENHCKALGLLVRGKESFSLLGEYTANDIRKAILGRETAVSSINEGIPNRPPVMCAGCPHRGMFFAFKQLGLTVSGDIGCYTLGALPPLGGIDTCVCMGASIGVAHGMEKARGIADSRKTVAVIGDSTFMHSGITGLLNMVYNQSASTVVILDNSITGMTGHQHNPASGYSIKGLPAPKLDLEKLCEALGVARVRVVDPFHAEHVKQVLKEETEAEELSVIIARRVCALLPTFKSLGKRRIDGGKCKDCGMCLKIGCPAIMKQNGRVQINADMCAGCGYCGAICKFGAIGKKDGE